MQWRFGDGKPNERRTVLRRDLNRAFPFTEMGESKSDYKKLLICIVPLSVFKFLPPICTFSVQAQSYTPNIELMLRLTRLVLFAHIVTHDNVSQNCKETPNALGIHHQFTVQ